MYQMIPIAPAPGRTASVQTQPAERSFNCRDCVRKKIKCNRTVPCSSCCRAKLQCVYQPPQAPRRKRSRKQHVYDRLAQYERILKDNNLLPTDSVSTTPPVVSNTPSGQLLSAAGKSRYVDNVLLLDDEGDLCEVSDSDEDRDEPSVTNLINTPYTVSGAKSITDQHPSYKDATELWMIYLDNVEPLCKVLHVPTVANMVDGISKDPATASKSDECLLFVIYYFAVYSMSGVDCLQKFNTAKTNLMSRYHIAAHQAFINVSLLKTTSIPVLQAYTLFLIAMRTQIDPHTFWILTGIAIRTAQRMGLHRDGEPLGLQPFDIQMRRRLFWQLLPLDAYAAQVSGTGISLSPNSWDTKQPSNINDDQIYPSMMQPPQEQTGASEMLFCLSRIELSNFYTRTGVQSKESGDTIEFKGHEEVESLINEVENSIETKYLRYCDILNPLHTFTTGIVRAATNAVRLHAQMPLLLKQSVTDTRRRDLCTLAARILDTNSAIYSNPALNKYRWHMQAFFLWDALLCILLNLAEVGFYSASELDSAWTRVAEVYSNHEELVHGRRRLYMTLGKMTLKAWYFNPPGNLTAQPGFVTVLSGRFGSSLGSASINAGNGFILDVFNNDEIGFGLDSDFTLGSPDWALWDQLCRDQS
ncbi:fungal-specific transcription factor domain-containing protein, partial [Aspergillus californicus]